ncbi:MAG: T9SS type A sorting domain-containing protein [Crocinitomicaceae bacterium]|nr:T9SS type A sorting domain-containing protein [Crocinitomicaceae bacterium]
MKLNFSIVRLAAIYTFMMFAAPSLYTQVSVAREWNEILLEAIRNDFARPTVHARNLYHHSIAAYDAWAIYQPEHETYLIGDSLDNYISPFEGINTPLELNEAIKETISYASFYFIKNRYHSSPDYNATYILMYNAMIANGYSVNNINLDYENGGPAELGNFIAQEIINYGLNDGSNELLEFENTFYTSINPPLIMSEPGNPDIIDPNRWQTLTLDSTIDQSGNLVDNTLPFLSPEWGNVSPFALKPSMSNMNFRDGDWYKVYFDSVQPSFLNIDDSSDWESFYKWNHSLVSIWQSHLDPNDGVSWDISPASIGNNSWYPTDSLSYIQFYNLTEGGDPSQGHTTNPITGEPYEPQIVPRADYARVLAEFWADGIDSETPPGHWFEIFHYVSDQPTFERSWQGQGPELSQLEYDLKAHLTLGGTMHDAAIAAWSLKGYYDYIRPVSSIRYMASNGQSTDPLLPNYNTNGIPLLENYIALVDSLDPLVGQNFEHLNKIKLYTWKGHDFIDDPEVDVAGVGWILGENWWPYQRPTFVTPPFSGFVSGHSTFSRAAAGILEYITGSAYFPGGLGEFVADENDFLQFEEGPSTEVRLQWATYRDAADQCSLSRIWGGIHPPIDDIPGRNIGTLIGQNGFQKADSLFAISNPSLIATSISDTIINSFDFGQTIALDCYFNRNMNTSNQPIITLVPANLSQLITVNSITWIDSAHFQVEMGVGTEILEQFSSLIRIQNIESNQGIALETIILQDYLIIDTKRPKILSLNPNVDILTDTHINESISATLLMSEPCMTNEMPQIDFFGENYINQTLIADLNNSVWLSSISHKAYLNLIDFNEEIEVVHFEINNIKDIHGNPLSNSVPIETIEIDTRNPSISNINISDTLINIDDLNNNSIFTTLLTFDETMDIGIPPEVLFENNSESYNSLVMNPFQSLWLDSTTFEAEIWALPDTNDFIHLDLSCVSAYDRNGNLIIDSLYLNQIESDLKNPIVLTTIATTDMISDQTLGNQLYYIDIGFNEVMDVEFKPLVYHEGIVNLNASIQYDLSESYFLDSINYRAYFQINDQNIEEDSIDLKISLGRDKSQNTQLNQSNPLFVELDTKNPKIIGLNANTTSLNAIDNWLDVSLLFDEAMDVATSISVIYNPIISLPAELNQNNYEWIDNDSLVVSFLLSSAGATEQIHAIEISEGTDLAGNLLIEFQEEDFITIQGTLDISANKIKPISLNPNITTSGQKITLVNIPKEYYDKDVQIYNSSGKLLKKIKVEANNNASQIISTQLDSGVYIVKICKETLRLIIL